MCLQKSTFHFLSGYLRRILFHHQLTMICARIGLQQKTSSPLMHFCIFVINFLRTRFDVLYRPQRQTRNKDCGSNEYYL